MNKTFRYVSMIFVAMAMAGCGGTQVVEQWADPSYDEKFTDLLVLSLNYTDTRRRLFETGFSNQIDKLGTQSTPSYELIPDHPKVSADAIKAAIAGTDIDGVLVLRQVRIKKEEHYSPPAYQVTPYIGFSSYYGAYAPTQGHFTEDTIVHLETNLYAVEGEKLVWSGKTETFNPTDANKLVEQLAQTIIGRISKAGMI